MKFHIKKGDTVKVLSGNSRGRTGVILQVFPEKYRAIVEGLNVVSKHVKPTAEKPEGGIVKQEASIHLSNLMLLDPSTGNSTRVGRKPDENGKLQRYSKKTGEIIKNG